MDDLTLFNSIRKQKQKKKCLQIATVVAIVRFVRGHIRYSLVWFSSICFFFSFFFFIIIYIIPK